MKPQIQAKSLHIAIIVLMILSIIFLSVGYSIAETQGLTSCALEVPGFIELREVYGFKSVQVKVCFEGSLREPGPDDDDDNNNATNVFKQLCNPGQTFAWYVLCTHLHFSCAFVSSISTAS